MKLKLVYDIQGRVISEDSTSGRGITSVSYDQNSSIITNSLGRKSTISSKIIGDKKTLIGIDGVASPNCPASNRQFVYSESGLLTKIIDAKGNITTYGYNDRGLETSRTEASDTEQARTVTTEWHPTLFLKAKVTEPDRITNYQYDVQGRQIGQTITNR